MIIGSIFETYVHTSVTPFLSRFSAPRFPISISLHLFDFLLHFFFQQSTAATLAADSELQFE